MRYAFFVMVFLYLLLVYACGRKQAESSFETCPPLTKEEVTRIYGLYLNENYMEYVAHMESSKGKPSEYIRQMATLFKQHAVESEHKNGQVRGCEVSRLRNNGQAHTAQAFVNLTYADGNTEEIQLLFVYKNGNWMLR